jgi:hypothetical protein
MMSDPSPETPRGTSFAQVLRGIAKTILILPVALFVIVVGGAGLILSFVGIVIVVAAGYTATQVGLLCQAIANLFGRRVRTNGSQ